MIQISEDRINCTGCGACIEVCGSHCIKLDIDQDGFLYANINKDNCKDCGQCDRVCPNITKPFSEPFSQRVYAAWAKEQTIRDSGSSGGMFLLFALKAIEKDGVVYGAAFDSNLRLSHMRVTAKDDLFPLCKSKYLQSDTDHVYQKVKTPVSIMSQNCVTV